MTKNEREKLLFERDKLAKVIREINLSIKCIHTEYDSKKHDELKPLRIERKQLIEEYNKIITEMTKLKRKFE